MDASSKTILIVDDEHDLRQALAFDLKRRGHTIFEASSCQQAVEILSTRSVDIILTDVKMPNGSGIDLLEQVRARDPKYPAVILLSGFAELDANEALRLGATALLEKPIERKKMHELLQNIAKRPAA